MKLTKAEYKALRRWVRSKGMDEVDATTRLRISSLDPDGIHSDLKKLGRDSLQRLVDQLPAGKAAHVHSPLLHSARAKMKTSVAGLRVPHLDPESWPQCYRMQTRLNNARAGLRSGPVGQMLRLHPKGMSVRLGGRIVWNEKNGGDLHIMGTWADISKAITDGGTGLVLASEFGDLYRDDVNAQMDEMLGSLPGDDPTWAARKDEMPLVVSCQAGALWKKSDDEGEVVLNAPKEVVELVAGRTVGVLGQIPQATVQSVTLDTIGTVGPTAWEGGKKLFGMRREINPDKALYTVTVGLGPLGEHYRIAGGAELSGAELLELAVEARPV